MPSISVILLFTYICTQRIHKLKSPRSWVILMQCSFFKVNTYANQLLFSGCGLCTFQTAKSWTGISADHNCTLKFVISEKTYPLAIPVKSFYHIT